MNMTVKILYSDEYLAVAVKPVGVLSQPDRTGDESMTALLSRQLGKPVYPIHRLDRSVGGVMVYAIDKKAAGKLSAAVVGKTFEKEYLAVIHGKPEKERDTLRDYLCHDGGKNMASVGTESDKGAKPASLSYERMAVTEDERFSLVRVRLHTGRTHQIRVQFASRGMAVAGDSKYGARDRHPLSLWSFRLGFRHPVNNKRLVFTEFPDITAMPWNYFSL